MIQFRLFGFPVRVEFWILVTAVFIGPRNDGLPRLLIWIGCVLLGIMIHELGHAFAAQAFGLRPVIALHAFGGTTSWTGERELSRAQRAATTAAGPAVGIAIGVLVWIVAIAIGPQASPLVSALFQYLIFVNLGWGLLNLFPIFPLDGGQLLMLGAEAIGGATGRMIALVISLLVLGAVALWAVLTRQIWLMIICGLLGWSNFTQFAGRKPGSPPPSENQHQPPSQV